MFVTYSIDCFVIKSESGKKMAKYAEINDSIFFSIIAPAYKDVYGPALANPNGFSLKNHSRFIKRTKTK